MNGIGVSDDHNAPLILFILKSTDYEMFPKFGDVHLLDFINASEALSGCCYQLYNRSTTRLISRRRFHRD
jgi:hypothetical protein